MDMKPTVERRRAERRTTRVEAVLSKDGVRSHVMILDYQQSGLQIWVRNELAPDAEVQLSVAGYDLKARVQWCESKKAGLSLLHPLDADLQRMLSDAKEAVS